PRPGAAGHAGGDVDAVLLDRADRARPRARRARVLDDRPGAATARARLRDREQALALGLDAPPLAARADLRRGTRLGAGAVAGPAHLRGRDGQRDLGALDRLVEGDRDLGLEVAATLGAPPPPAPAGR